MDYTLLYQWVMDERVNHRWTTRGMLVPYDAFVQRLWQDVSMNLLVSPPSSAAPVAWVSIFSMDLHSGYCSVGVVSSPSALGSGAGIAAVLLSLGYLFDVFPVRKAYFESPSFAFQDFGSAADGARYLEVEGVLKDHLYFRGQYWDKIIATVTRESWDDRVGGLADRILRRLS